MSLASATFVRFVLPFSLCGSLAAQAVLVVAPNAGPGVDHTTLQAAIDASADGGIVLVKSGSYSKAAASFVISGKGMTLVADASGSVDFAAGTTGLVQSIQAQKNVYLRGFPDNDGTTLSVADCAGPVWIEECRLHDTATGFNSAPGLHALGSAQVIVEGCSLFGGDTVSWICTDSTDNAALVANASTVYVQDSVLQPSLLVTLASGL